MPDDPYQRTLHHAGETLTLHIKRARRKSLAIHVLAEGIEVRVPLKCPWRDIDDFIASRADWIVSAWGQVQDEPPLPKFVNGDYHEYLGKPRCLQVYPAKINLTRVEGDLLEICSRRPDCPEYNEKLFHDFLRRQGEDYFARRLSACLEAFPEPVAVKRLRLRRMRARWGSCSESGEICLNSMLMQKAPEAIDLVINHELCHLKHFNHNRAFYRLLDRAMPSWRAAEGLLNSRATRYGPKLMPAEQLKLF